MLLAQKENLILSLSEIPISKACCLGISWDVIPDYFSWKRKDHFSEKYRWQDFSNYENFQWGKKI